MGTFWGAVHGVTARTKECCPPGEGTRRPGDRHTLKEQQLLHNCPTVSCVLCHRVPRCPQCHRAELGTVAPGDRGGLGGSRRPHAARGVPAAGWHPRGDVARGAVRGAETRGCERGHVWVSAGERGLRAHTCEHTHTRCTPIRVSEHTRVGAWPRV